MISRLELLWLSLLPGLLTFFLMILGIAPKFIGDIGLAMPLLFLLPIFHWAQTQSRDMPYWVVFALGIVLDALSGVPLGLHALGLLFFLILVHSQRKYIHKEGFIIKWAYLAGLLAIILVGQWLVVTVFLSRAVNVGVLLLQWLFTVACYPALYGVFERMVAHISHRRWKILHSV